MKILITESQLESQVVYHGTNNKFKIFDDSKPIFFVDNIKVARTYGDIIVKAKLDINNPLELNFEGNSTYFFWNKWYLPSDLAMIIKEISDDMKNFYSLNEELVEYLESLDFNFLSGNLDGIIMENIKDAHEIFSTHESATNYVVFNKNQIKII